MSPPTPPTIAELTLDNKSLTVRNRTLFRALRLAVAAPRIVAVLPGPDREFDRIVFLSNGGTLEHRWTKDAGWCYVPGAPVPTTAADIASDALADSETHARAEMAVVGDALPAEMRTRLELSL